MAASLGAQDPAAQVCGSQGHLVPASPPEVQARKVHLTTEDSAKNSERCGPPSHKATKRYKKKEFNRAHEANVVVNLSPCKIKAVLGFAITHETWSYLLDTVRAEEIRNSGQGKSSFTKAYLSPQGLDG